MEIREHVPLAPLTTFGIGGSARYMAEARTEDDIREAISWAVAHGVGYTILAGGSNVLVPDEGLSKLVVRLTGDLWSTAGTEVDAWAGSRLLALIRAMAARGLGGWEKLSGIPGSVGGAVRGNAGAFGAEIRDFLVEARALHARTLETRAFSNADCEFSYRDSYFKQHAEWIVTRVKLRLSSISREASERLIAETVAEREKRHLQNVRAAGSFFMNPAAPREIQELFERERGVLSREGRVPAGWLIERAGMKGARAGGAIASLQHPNYLVNQSDATAADVLALSEKIKSAVFEKFGVRLLEEAAIL